MYSNNKKRPDIDIALFKDASYRTSFCPYTSFYQYNMRAKY